MTAPRKETFLTPTAPHVPWFKRLARRVPERWRTRIHWWVYDTPVLSEIASKHDTVMRIAHVSPDTRLVLDGYPRSGNSYARAAFKYANGIELPISTHGHSHRFPRRGVQRGIPVIVLIREPGAAIASLLTFSPTSTPLMLARAYTRYYRGILPILDSVVIAPFELVTSDFGAILGRCNARFGSEFRIYEPTPEAERDVHAHIDAGTRNAVPDELFDAVVPRPGFRQRRTENLDAGNPRTARAMAEARAVHRQVLAAAGFTDLTN